MSDYFEDHEDRIRDKETKKPIEYEYELLSAFQRYLRNSTASSLRK
jgi:hypothetical protein